MTKEAFRHMFYDYSSNTVITCNNTMEKAKLDLVFNHIPREKEAAEYEYIP